LPLPIQASVERREPHRDEDLAALSRREFIAVGLTGGLVLTAEPVFAQSTNGAPSMEIKISVDRTVPTLVNVFSVEPDRQKALLELLIDGTETFFAKQPGFVAASFHNSEDGQHIVNYSQWRNPKDVEAFRGARGWSPSFVRLVLPADSCAGCMFFILSET
jgi:Antibiotic biosynthesis monooxygenase